MSAPNHTGSQEEDGGEGNAKQDNDAEDKNPALTLSWMMYLLLKLLKQNQTMIR